MQIRLAYEPSKALRDRWLIDTGQPLATVEYLTVDTGAITREQRAVIVPLLTGQIATIPALVRGMVRGHDGQPLLDNGIVLTGGQSDPRQWDAVPTLDAWCARAAAFAQTNAAWEAKLADAMTAWQAEQKAAAARAAAARETADADLAAVRRLEAAGDLAALRAFHIRTAGLSPKDARYYEQQRDDAIRSLEAAARDAAKSAWAAAHGSPLLQRALAAGYDCQRLYVTERAALEAPGFDVDFDNEAAWKSRSCPSAAALDLADRVQRLPGAQVEIVWLTQPIDGEDDAYEFEPCETVAVTRYLDRYTLIKIVA
jgi:hypothetical protein